MLGESIKSKFRKMARPFEVFRVFLRLGLTSFGGPIAHLSYFRLELVEKRKWISESQFAQLLAICQFLPGPASSQLGFSLGLLRAGWGGAIAAFISFTAPSVVMLLAFAAFLPMIDGAAGGAAVHGLKIVALAVVGHGVSGMQKQLCPDARRKTIAILSAVFVLMTKSALAQLLVVAFGAFAGVFFCRGLAAGEGSNLDVHYGPKTGWILLAVFIVILIGLPLVAFNPTGLLSIADAFYRAGALVFGGGHVVLPLLEEAVVGNGWISRDQFLAGYGAAQAVPGPMFSFSAYLGGLQGGFQSALIALVSIFLPGFLLVAGVLPIWRSISGYVLSGPIIAGVNASVVGLLGAALYDPIFVSAVNGPGDLAIGLAAFMLIAVWRCSALWVVAWCVVSSLVIRMIF